MSDEIQQWAKHSGVASIIEAIANWVRNYRYAVGLRAELAHCGAEEVAHIAHDLGMGPAEFTALAQRGPDAANQLPRLLRALGVDPKELASVDPATMRAMERICITCGQRINANTIWLLAALRRAVTAITARTHCHLTHCLSRASKCRSEKPATRAFPFRPHRGGVCLSSRI